MFTGNMNYLPNREAISYFIVNIWPLVIEALPETLFIVAGYEAGLLEAQYKHVPNLKFESSPKDIRPFYNKAWLVVVPLLSGSGTRLKILEAMAMHKKVISTSIGAEGLNSLVGEQLIIEDNPKMFAKKVHEFLTTKKTFELCDQLVDYEWDNITEALNISEF